MIDPHTLRGALSVQDLDTLSPAGIYYRPCRVGRDGRPEGDEGDFFEVYHKDQTGAPRASLLPWSAPLDGNTYPMGDIMSPGVAFDPREIGGPWFPMAFVPRPPAYLHATIPGVRP